MVSVYEKPKPWDSGGLSMDLGGCLVFVCGELGCSRFEGCLLWSLLVGFRVLGVYVDC